MTLLPVTTRLQRGILYTWNIRTLWEVAQLVDILREALPCNPGPVALPWSDSTGQEYVLALGKN